LVVETQRGALLPRRSGYQQPRAELGKIGRRYEAEDYGQAFSELPEMLKRWHAFSM